MEHDKYTNDEIFDCMINTEQMKLRQNIFTYHFYIVSSHQVFYLRGDISKMRSSQISHSSEALQTLKQNLHSVRSSHYIGFRDPSSHLNQTSRYDTDVNRDPHPFHNGSQRGDNTQQCLKGQQTRVKNNYRILPEESTKYSENFETNSYIDNYTF